VASSVKQRRTRVGCRLALPRPAQRLERTLQAQSPRRLVLPGHVPKRRPTPHRTPQRRQLARRLDPVDVLQPTQRQGQGPAVQQIQTPTLDPPCQTRPRPPFGPQHQMGTQGVAFDITANDEKVIVLLDRKALEAALVERTGAAAVVVGVPPHGMRQGQPVQEVGQLAVLLRPQDEVEVVGHEAIGQQARGCRVLSLAQDALKGGVVAVFVGNGGAAHGSRIHRAARPHSSGSEGLRVRPSSPGGTAPPSAAHPESVCDPQSRPLASGRGDSGRTRAASDCGNGAGAERILAYLAVLLRRRGRLREAIAAAQSGRLHCPNDPELLLLHAVLLREGGDWINAETCLVRLLESENGDRQRRTTARHNLALVCRGMGRRSEAVAHWQTLLAEEPDFLEARRCLADCEPERTGVQQA
jgi:hypothetical protein